MAQIQYEQRINAPEGDQLVQVTETHHWFSPGRVIGGALGLVLAFIGTVALLKTGIGPDLTTPQTTVFGMAQSAAIGVGELTAGLLLLLFAAWEDARPLMAVIGVFAIIGGVVGAVASPEIQQDVGFSSMTAWFIALCGGIAVIAAVLPAVYESRRNVQATDEPGRTHAV